MRAVSDLVTIRGFSRTTRRVCSRSVRELARRKGAGRLLADAFRHVIEHAYELSEFVALC